ncbi:MAG: tetratricopeptide repeat protein, partial [Candidatus Obscuribacterales bacterium]|nr:tetratricopeptide repeat protein [Candidatus Obscuribacterales bacterium]
SVGENRFVNPVLAKSRVLLSQNKHQEAEELIRRHYETLPEDNKLVHEVLAIAMSGQPDKAKESLAILDDLIEENPSDSVIRRTKAELLLRMSLYLLAEKEYSILYEKMDKEDPDVWLCLSYARILKELGKTAESASVINDLRKQASALKMHEFFANHLIELGETDDAVSMYQELLKSNTNPELKGELLYGLSYACLKDGNPEDSLKYGLEAARCANQTVSSKLIGRIGWIAEGRDIAIKILEVINARYPDTPDLLLLQGQFQIYAKHATEGIQTLNRYMQLKPEDQVVKKLLADVLTWNRHRGEAIDMYNQLLKDDPGNLEVVLALSHAQSYDRKNREQALFNIQRYLEKRPDDVAARLSLAYILSGLGRTEESAAIYNQIRAKNPDNHKLLLDLARIEVWHPPSQQDGWTHYKEYLNLNPHDKEILRELADTMTWSNRRREALAIYQELLDTKPDDIQLRIGYARLLMINRKVNTAKKVITTVLTTEPTNPRAMCLLAQIFSYTNYPFKAEKILRRARSLYPQDREVSIISAGNWRQMGRIDKALKEIRRCHKIIEAELSLSNN